MPDYPPDAGTGFLRRNEKASKPSHPSHTGTATVDGVKYFVSAWVNEGDDGKKYFKLSFRPAEDRSDDRQPQRGGRAQFDDQIPFAMDP